MSKMVLFVRMYYPVLLAVAFLAVVVLGGCTPMENRLVPTGQSVTVAQGAQFCLDNPDSDACSK